MLMAKCTLDDMTPSYQCSRVVLNPVQELDLNGVQTGNIDYGKYRVAMHVEVYDTIDDHSEGIADYLLSNGIEYHVKCYMVYSRDTAVKDLMNFLQSHQSGYREILGQSAEYGYNDGHKSYLFHGATKGAATNSHAPASNGSVGVMWTALSSAQQLNFIEKMNSVSYSSFASTNPFSDITETAEYDLHTHLDTLTVSILSTLDQMLGDTQFMVTSSFRGKYMYHIIKLAQSEYEYSWEFMNEFQAYSGMLIEDLLTQDEDGNQYYSLPLPFPISFDNDISVENCYVHTYCFYDMQQHLDISFGITEPIPVEPGTERWSYSTVNELAILSNKRPASSKVVDTRLIERIEEIIRSDYTSPYESSIDQLSLLSSEFRPANSGIISRLFTSYELAPRGTSTDDYDTYTVNYFYINFAKYFIRKSKLSFMYDMADTSPHLNLDSFINNNINNIVKDIYITRIRVDAEEPPVRIKQGLGDIQRMSTIVDGGYMYMFYDNEMTKLTDGEYVYKINITFQDMMYRAMRVATMQVQRTIALLDEAIRYIHNHPSEYNELRDSITEKGRMEIYNILSPSDPNEPFMIGVAASDYMLRTFSGLTFLDIGVLHLDEEYVNNMELSTIYDSLVTDVIGAGGVIYQNTGAPDWPLTPLEDYICPTNLTDVNKINRRYLENYNRILRDLVAAAHKFVGTYVGAQEIVTNNHANASGVTKTEFLDFDLTWKNDVVHAAMDFRAMCEMTKRQNSGTGYHAFTSAHLDQEFRNELEKHSGPTSDAIWNSHPPLRGMNFFTPYTIGKKVIDYNGLEDHTDLISKIRLIEASVRKPGHLKQQITSRLYEQITGEYEDTVEELKNDSGLFESLLHDQGTTITNKTAQAWDTHVTVEKTRSEESVFGIDHGSNEPEDKFSRSEEEQEAIDEANEKRNLIKEALFKEKQKVEHLTMDVLIDVNGHHLLDRRDFTQGLKRTIKFKRYDAFEIVNNVINAGKPHPRLADALLLDYYRNSYSSTIALNPITVLSSRFVVDNTFLVYYLSGFDVNMNPIWVELLRGDVPNILPTASSYGQTYVLCKLERFSAQHGFTNIGIGSSSELEIIGKYFYLVAG